MIPALRPTLQALGQFLRAPSLGRTVVALLTGAIALLLIVNIAVFVMLERTRDFNDTVDRGQRIRLVANEVMALSVDAETGQRGFLLTERAEYLEPYTNGVVRLPEELGELASLTAGDPDMSPRIERLTDLSQQRIDVIHAHMFGSNLWGSVLGRLTGVPVILAHARGNEAERIFWREAMEGRRVSDDSERSSGLA